jgi:WD40 repeat protein
VVPSLDKSFVTSLPIPHEFVASFNFDPTGTQLRAGVAQGHGLPTAGILAWNISPSSDADEPPQFTPAEANASRIFGAEYVNVARLDRSALAIASTTADNKVTVHFSDSDRVDVALSDWDGDVWRVVVSDDATRAAILYLDATIHIWDLDAGRLLARHHLSGRPALDAVFVGADMLRVLQFDRQNEPETAPNEFGWPGSGERIKLVVRVFDLALDDVTVRRVNIRSPSRATTPKFWPSDGSEILHAVTESGEMAAIWNKSSIRFYVPEQPEPVRVILTRGLPTSGTILRFSKSGRWLAALGSYGMYSGDGFAVWNVETGAMAGGIVSSLASMDRLQFSPDESQILIGGKSGGISRYSIKKLNKQHRAPGEKAKPEWSIIDAFLPAVVSGDRTRLYAFGGQGIGVFDYESGILLAEFPISLAKPPSTDYWIQWPVRETEDARVLIRVGYAMEAWDFSSIPNGNAFQVACALLPDHSWENVLEGGKGQLGSKVICPDGYDPPAR